MSDPKDTELPFELIRHGLSGETGATRMPRLRRRYFLVLLAPVFMFAGAVIGMYFQPPALRIFYAVTGLQPGGGSASPIALPPEIELPQEMAATMQATDVVGLARLIPRGDISIVAPPFGSGDARIAEILVAAGDRVEKGIVVARLDNIGQLQSAVLQAEANIAVRQAALVQTRQAVQNSRNEAKAALAQTQSTASEAAAEQRRAKELFRKGVTTQAALDSSAAAERQAVLAVTKAQATLARFTSEEVDMEPDVIVASRNLDAAEADLGRAREDQKRAEVLSPTTGVVLEVNSRAGERPPAGGIMQIGDTDHMMAEVEVYQDRIAAVDVGQHVELAAVAIGRTLLGKVQFIGLIVGRQGLVSDDTAANTDARVITVMVELDSQSSEIAARYTNLEVIARIDTRSRAIEPAKP